MENIINKNKVLKTICVTILFWVIQYIQLIPIYLFHIDIKTISSELIIILNLLTDILLAIILFFIYKKDLKEEFKKFKSNLLECLDKGLFWWIIGVVIMLITNSLINIIFKSPQAANEQTVRSMIKTLPIIMILNAGIIAPFNEEIVFRKALKDVFKNTYLFVFFSFLLFGGGHVISSAKTLVDYLYIIPYGALGIAFAITYNKTNTVFTSMFFHMFHNTALILLYLQTIL